MAKISACVITKNEEKNLPLWMESMRRIADEMIVVDTGSKDRTVKIAEEGGARLFHFEWIDDFSAAKNFAIDQAKGDWIVFLDADEYFTTRDCAKVRELIRRNHRQKNVAGLMIERINIDLEDKSLQKPGGFHIRIFRRSPKIRYQRPIHESLENSGSGEFMYADGVVFYHTGYSASIVKDKLLRNLDILLKKREEGNETPADSYYFADCYYGLGDYENAARYARQFIESGASMVTLQNRPYLVLVQSLISMKRPQHEIDEAIRLSEKRFPKDPEYALMDGINAFRNRDYLRAEKSLSKGISLAEAAKRSGRHDPHVTDHSGDLIHAAYEFLARISRARGDDDAALELVVSGIFRSKSYAPLTQLAISLLAPLGDAELIEVLGEWYDDGDASYLSPLVGDSGRGAAALYYEGKSGSNIFMEYDRYFLAEKYDAAAANLADETSALSTLAFASGQKDAAPLFPEGFSRSAYDRLRAMNHDLMRGGVLR